MFLKTIKFLLKVLFWLLLLLTVIFIIIYALSPVYKFPEYKAFSGDKIHNPYQGMDSTAWKKGNFQVQSRVWLGLTNGRHNTNDAIQTIYRQLGYDIIVTSDYMTINPFGEDRPTYIPTYEHGYSYRKVHQVCIGSQKVNWIDYPVYQNINHKQHIINILRKNNEIVTLAHPDLRDGYTLDDLRLLSNYDLIEVLNEARFSVNHWDAALSSGHPAYILANDDAHNIFDPTEVGRICTFINTPTLNAGEVMQAMKAGRAFGADIAMREGADFVERSEDHKRIPVLKAMKLNGDTLSVRVSQRAKLISFIGQNGVVKQMVQDTTAARYVVQADDSYIRTEILFDNGSRFYLNPVYRYSGNQPAKPPQVKIDQIKTWVKRGIALIVTIIIVLIISRLAKGKPKKGKINRRPNYYYQR